MSSEDWEGFSQAIRARSVEKRAGNRASSQQLLAEQGIDFTSNNDGAHLVITHHGVIFDFWPGTGKWSQRGTGKYNRGVFNLIKAARRQEPKP